MRFDDQHDEGCGLGDRDSRTNEALTTWETSPSDVYDNLVPESPLVLSRQGACASRGDGSGVDKAGTSRRSAGPPPPSPLIVISARNSHTPSLPLDLLRVVLSRRPTTSNQQFLTNHSTAHSQALSTPALSSVSRPADPEASNRNIAKYEPTARIKGGTKFQQGSIQL